MVGWNYPLRKKSMMRYLCSLFALLSILLLAGCGGSGSSTSGTRAVPVKLTIYWSVRSRVASGPSSALSATISLLSAGQDGKDVTFTVNRHADPAAYVETYVTPVPVANGNWQGQILFYAQPGGIDPKNGAGGLVGQAYPSVVVADSGVTADVVRTTGTIVAVYIPSGAPFTVTVGGAAVPVPVSVRDTNGIEIAVSPGSVFLTVEAGDDKVSVSQGQAAGLAPGTALIQASVDGIHSKLTSVTATSTATLTVSPTSSTVPVKTSQTFSAALTPANLNQAVTWAVQEGDAGGVITDKGVYTAPTTLGIYHVVATSVYDPSKTAVATITVALTVAIDPTQVSLGIGASQSFHATVYGDTKGVTWQVLEGAAGGTVSADGLYTAPNTAGTFHVVATSVTDLTKSATATVAVKAGSGVVTVQ